jgi:hypothetical protein
VREVSVADSEVRVGKRGILILGQRRLLFLVSRWVYMKSECDGDSDE